MTDDGYGVDDLDDLDRDIISSLQRDARNVSASEIAASKDIAPSTVRKRIHRLEDRGYIRGYRPLLDHTKLGFPFRALFTCTAPISTREQGVNAAGDVLGVLAVRELMTGTTNVHVDAVVRDQEDLTRVARELDECGLNVVDEFLIRSTVENPLPGFAPEE